MENNKGVLVGSKNGKQIIHTDGNLGGYIKGNRHSNGGVPAINTNTGQLIEVEGTEVQITPKAVNKTDTKNFEGEMLTNKQILSKINQSGGGVPIAKKGGLLSLPSNSVIITSPAVADNSKREFEGEMLTNREILSRINQEGGGVAFEDGGSLKDFQCPCSGHKYNYGGNLMEDHDIVKEIHEEERIKERQAYYRSLPTTSYQEGGEIEELTDVHKTLLQKFGNGERIVVISKNEVPGVSYLEEKALIYITPNTEDHTKMDVFITEDGKKFIDKQGGDYFEDGGGLDNINAANFNSWRNGPGYQSAIIDMNEKDIDYRNWNDVQIYQWWLKKEDEDSFEDGGEIDESILQKAIKYNVSTRGKTYDEWAADMQDATGNFYKNKQLLPVYKKMNYPSPMFKEGGNIEKDESYYKGTKHNYENQFLINKAIEALIESVPADLMTPEEKNFVAYYAGYGGLEKYGASGKGLLYEYFTPSVVAKKMWGLAYKHGFDGGKVLEPACGIGEFIKYAPDQQLVTGYEINEFSAKICRILYPNAKIVVKPFETVFIKNNNSIRDNLSGIGKYSLVIGNPPYGSMGGIYAGMGEKKHTKANNYIEYFISRGLDLLEPGGLLIYIIGTEVAAGGKPFLQQPNNPLKGEIAEKASLVDAYRLYNGLFETTDVLTDIVVFKKK